MGKTSVFQKKTSRFSEKKLHYEQKNVNNGFHIMNYFVPLQS